MIGVRTYLPLKEVKFRGTRVHQSVKVLVAHELWLDQRADVSLQQRSFLQNSGWPFQLCKPSLASQRQTSPGGYLLYVQVNRWFNVLQLGTEDKSSSARLRHLPTSKLSVRTLTSSDAQRTVDSRNLSRTVETTQARTCMTWGGRDGPSLGLRQETLLSIITNGSTSACWITTTSLECSKCAGFCALRTHLTTPGLNAWENRSLDATIAWEAGKKHAVK